MGKVSSDAFAIRTVDFSESSLILTLFTREYGKIHAIAKGARRPKNPFESALDLLAQVNVMFIRKNGEVLDLLTEGKLLRRFRPDQTTIQGLNAGYYLAELIDLLTADADPMPELYDLAVQTLNGYQSGNDVPTLRTRFEWFFLEQIGHRLSLRNCVLCGDSVPLEGFLQRSFAVPFLIEEGGVICPHCAKEPLSNRPHFFPPDALLYLESLDRKEEISHGEPLRDPVRRAVRFLLDQTFLVLIGRAPRTQSAAP